MRPKSWHKSNGTMLRYAINCFNNNEVAKFSSGKQYWNYLYEDDAGKMFYLLGKKDIDSGIYNIASNSSRILREYIEECASLFDNPKYEFAKEDNNNVYGLNVDVSKVIKALDYIPKVDFKEGIVNMIEIIKTGGVVALVDKLINMHILDRRRAYE